MTEPNDRTDPTDSTDSTGSAGSSDTERPIGSTDRSKPADRTNAPDTDTPKPMNDTNTPEQTAAQYERTGAPTEERRSGDDESPSERFDRFTTAYLRGLLDRIGLAALVLLALIAGWSFYSQTGAAIRTWLDPAYQPLALATFNLAVLLVALAGIAHQLGRIRNSEGQDDDPTESMAE